MRNLLCAIGLFALVCGCGPQDGGNGSGQQPPDDAGTAAIVDETAGGEREGAPETGTASEAPDMDSPMGEDVAPESESDLDSLMAEAEKAETKETKEAWMVADRALGWTLVDYGRRADQPCAEAIILGVQILHRNPTKSIVDTEEAEGGEKEQLEKLVEEAAEMRPDDETLLAMAENVADALDEAPRGLAPGQVGSWNVEINRGKYYRLDPRLIYNAQEAAIITASSFLSDPNAMLGVTVRRCDQRNIKKRAVRKGRVSAEWNPGIHTTGWDCRVYNLTGPDGLKVTVEAKGPDNR